MTTPEEIERYQALRDVVARLRAPDGCPWDREQTHATLRPYLIEEAYEVLACLDAGDTRALPEELGDLLFQILIHTQLAEEAGEFDMAQILGGLNEKLIRRHPHVFGDVDLETVEQVSDQWDDLKKQERTADTSALANVPPAMPALAYSQMLLRRAAKAGFAWPHRDDILVKLQEEVAELAAAPSPEAAAEELGDILLNIANYARALDIDAEEALRNAGHKFRRRFSAVEAGARTRGVELTPENREELMALWNQAKAMEVPD